MIIGRVNLSSQYVELLAWPLINLFVIEIEGNELDMNSRCSQTDLSDKSVHDTYYSRYTVKSQIKIVFPLPLVIAVM